MQPHDGRVVPQFILQALQNLPITVYGDGAQTRSFCYVDDLLGAMIAMMETGDSVTGPVNAGNPEEISILALAQAIIELTGSSSVIVNRPAPQDYPRQRSPDIARARKELDWRPDTQLREGLSRTIRYFEDLLRLRGRAGAS